MFHLILWPGIHNTREMGDSEAVRGINNTNLRSGLWGGQGCSRVAGRESCYSKRAAASSRCRGADGQGLRSVKDCEVVLLKRKNVDSSCQQYKPFHLSLPYYSFSGSKSSYLHFFANFNIDISHLGNLVKMQILIQSVF